ncbi:hypothetical protein BD311DRAFT_767456 [Dichomitus squalens]|uniref:Uncharacterized protein n=1 Tax=Dichomitus squalens TaxID=114155 RepID=A0A4Q9MA15_9APHY|nr:hypothetical protein BD311DRAFT_767456 [Dichomitus squalens]
MGCELSMRLALGRATRPVARSPRLVGARLSLPLSLSSVYSFACASGCIDPFIIITPPFILEPHVPCRRSYLSTVAQCCPCPKSSYLHISRIYSSYSRPTTLLSPPHHALPPSVTLLSTKYHSTLSSCPGTRVRRRPCAEYLYLFVVQASTHCPHAMFDIIDHLHKYPRTSCSIVISRSPCPVAVMTRLLDSPPPLALYYRTASAR